MNVIETIIDCPIGNLAARFEGGQLVSLVFTDMEAQPAGKSKEEVKLRREVKSYFDGNLKQFTIDVNANGSAFETKVWEEVSRVRFGHTTSYQDIANALENPGASRAVGLANGKNPCLLVIPCHRIIGSSGKLTGYAGGLDRKRKLIQHEQLTEGMVLF